MKFHNILIFVLTIVIIIILINYCRHRVDNIHENFYDEINYNYREQIPTPSSMCVGSDSNIFQLYNNSNAVNKYFNMITRGPPIGNSYFVKSGICGQNSDPACRGQTKYLYINNKPTGKIPGTNYYSSNRGFLNGLMGDVTSINPFPLYSALKGGKKNTKHNKCQSRIITTGNYPNFRQQRICLAENCNC